MDTRILLIFAVICNSALLAFAACPTTFCDCPVPNIYDCRKNAAGISETDLGTILASAVTDKVEQITINKFLGATLKTDAFKAVVAKLKVLTIEGSPAVTKVEEKAFQGLLKLSELNLKDLSVLTVPEGLLQPVKSTLTKFKIERCTRLTTIPAKMFDGLINLVELGLEDSGLTTIVETLFQPIKTTLKTLSLKKNAKLMTLSAKLFLGMTRLKDLSLSETGLTSLPETIFQPVKASLRTLSLKMNAKLTSLPVNIFEGLRLTSLDLSTNKLTLFTAELIKDLKTATIDISQSSVNCACDGNIQDLIDWMTKNTKATLTGTCTAPATMNTKVLKTLKKDVVCPCPVAFCSCTATAYTCDKKTAGISESELATLILPNLLNTVKSLHLKKFNDVALPAEMLNQAVYGGRKIEELIIEGTTALTTFDDFDVFKGLTLKKLTISGTGATTLPVGLFQTLKATLEALSVSKNTKLATLPLKIFDGFTKLKDLDLTGNALTSLSIALIGGVLNTAKGKVDATSNPIDCACNEDIQGIIDYLAKSTLKVSPIKATCATPTALNTKTMKSLKATDVCPCPATLCTCTATAYTCNKVTEKELEESVLPVLLQTVYKLDIVTYFATTLKAEIAKPAEKTGAKLEELYLQGTAALTTVDVNAFKGLSLKTLSISETGVTTLPEGLFQTQKATLTQLMVDTNTKLTTLPVKIFDGLTKLTKLDLTSNGMSTFSASLFAGDAFKTAVIDTIGNPVDCSCNDDIAGLLKWQADNPSNKLTMNCESPGPLKGQKLKPALKDSICPCPSTMCTCTAAKYVCDKKGAGITEDDLVKVVLKDLAYFEGELHITKYLGATVKAELFKLAPNLKKLLISGTAVASVDKDAFKGLTSLVYLKITGTSVITLPETVFAAVKGTLTELCVTKNTKLAAIPAKAFAGLTKVTKLDIYDNAMTTLTSAMFADVKSATINADGNPIDCQCNDDIKGLLAWYKANPNGKLTVKCATPSTVATKMLKSLTQVDICGEPPETSPPKGMIGAIPDWAFVIIIAVVGVLIIVLVGVGCQVYKRRIYQRQGEEMGTPLATDGFDNQAYGTN